MENNGQSDIFAFFAFFVHFDKLIWRPPGPLWGEGGRSWWVFAALNHILSLKTFAKKLRCDLILQLSSFYQTFSFFFVYHHCYLPPSSWCRLARFPTHLLSKCMVLYFKIPRVSCNSSWKITWTATLIYLGFLIQQIAILDLRRESQLIDGWSPPVLHFQAVHLFTRSSVLIITFIFVVVFITIMIIIIKRFPEPEASEELMDFPGWSVLYLPIHGRLGGGTIPPNTSIQLHTSWLMTQYSDQQYLPQSHMAMILVSNIIPRLQTILMQQRKREVAVKGP